MARRIVIVGGGTAGWLTAAYLAKAFNIAEGARVSITLVEAPEIGSVGVGEGTFPTIRQTLRYLGLDEAELIRATTATFKQGIAFVDWLHAPDGERRHQYFHPFEAPFHADGTNLVPYWLLQDPAARPPFAEAMTIQGRVAESRRAPKQPGEGDFAGPLNYAYHIDAIRLAELLAKRARELGVVHLSGQLRGVATGPEGIARIDTDVGPLTADLFIDCTGFRAELIGAGLGSPFHDVGDRLFVDRAISCKLPYATPGTPLESTTIATAHEAGWIWDIGLAEARGIGCVYSSRHIDDDRAEAILRAYLGPAGADAGVRRIAFRTGWRERQWIGNCVAVGLSAGFLEPLESTGIVLIEAAVGMIAEMLPHQGPVDTAARRFNELMAARFETIVGFLKLHYCLSRRTEPFWRDNADPDTIPERLRELLAAWRYRPPSRFDFTLDVEAFAFFNYQYILYGMDFRTDLTDGRDDFPDAADARRQFARVRSFAEAAARELPSHRDLVDEIVAGARRVRRG